MDTRRRPAIGTVLLTLLLTGLLGACATPSAGGRLGEANGPTTGVTPTPAGTPAPISTPALAPPPAGGGSTARGSTGAAGHTPTHTPTHARSSAPPSSASNNPGDYSVAVANSQGVHECG